MHRFLYGSSRLALSVALVAIAGLLLGGCAEDGDDGRNGFNGSDGIDGLDGETGPPGPTVINASQVSDEFLDGLVVVSEITNIVIASPPVVTFTLATSTGVPITGIVPFWEDSNRYIRFTMTKLVPGVSGAPDNWVSYTRDADSNEPDYDTGSSVIDNGDGSYTFTFITDVTNVPGVSYEPTLTHRVAGQIGSRDVSLEPQNVFNDFVPDGTDVIRTRNIAVMEACNECHDDLVFHGRRFLVEYCVNCHNPDLADGEGNFSFMIHKIHNAGVFDILDDGFDASHVTYPQDLANCRKCHDGEDEVTAEGDNWKNAPNVAACDGCHENFSEGEHTAGNQPDSSCAGCHPASSIEGYHLTANATPNNPGLFEGQRNITYELIDASVDGENQVTVNFKILSDGEPLDLSNLPQDLLDGDRYPGLLLAWALPQGDLDEPMDYNNFGRKSAQPLSLGLGDFSPLETDEPIGTLSYDAATGVNTVVIDDEGSQFPADATLRAIGLQGYLRQGPEESRINLHTPSMVVGVDGDDLRREVVDSESCANCHEWFEGHGGNRVKNIEICTLCHVPNLSSGGRMIAAPDQDMQDDIQAAIDAGHLDGDVVDPKDPLTYPEDAQNLKDLVHGIHSSDFRTRAFIHVRPGSHGGLYDWSHITFPRGAETSNCMLCHKSGSYELPLEEGLLPSTVRTTGASDGQDATTEDAVAAFEDVPDIYDWVNSPTAASCFMCHTSADAMAHMMQNGGMLSAPNGSSYVNRQDLFQVEESCSVCHGSGRSADIEEVHNR